MLLRLSTNPLLAITLSTTAIVSVAQSGCGVDRETIQSLQTAVSAVSAQRDSDPERPATQADVIAAEVPFTPSHPERQNPFDFPEHAAVRHGHATAAQDTVAEVEVLGFANVGEQHVLLRSQEKSRSLRVGESIGAVRVVAINPPTVQLQMGSLIWSATMFDKSTGE